MRTSLASLLVVLLLIGGGHAQKANTAEPAKVRQTKQVISKELASFADWCLKNKFPATAKSCADEATLLDPENKKAADVAANATGEDSTDDDALKSFQRKRESTGKKLAPQYCDLFTAGPANARIDYDPYLDTAFKWDTEATDKWVEAAYKKAFAGKNYALTLAMLTAAVPHQDAESKLAKGYPERAKVMRQCEAELASVNPLLRQARTHTMQYYLSLPDGWTADKTWPILVAVDGAGSNFAGMNRSYGGKGNATYIVITPCSFSNTNSLAGQEKKYPYPKEVLEEWADNRMAFDEPGVLAALADVREDFNGEEKFFVTGFSGGGNITWHFIFTHPEMLAGAAPASANFSGLRAEVSSSDAKATVPIKVLQGEDDKFRPADSISPLDKQWEGAKALLEEHGYKNWTYELVPKTGHSPCKAQVLEFFGTLLPKDDDSKR
jgi:dienelactone hydrolase